MSTPSRGGLRPFQPMKFGRYSLLNLIAKGGMGAVYLARITSVEGFEKLVVIKKILPALAQQQDFVKRFVDEAKIVVKLQHGSIAQVLDMGVEGDEYYIAMEFVDGKDLRKVAASLRDSGATMPAALALYVTVRVLDALAYAHRKKDAEEQELNLVHRDISPQNVLVSYEGEVKVIDFGLAKSAASLGRTRPSVVLGKFFYMSPEQARHQSVDRRTDLYAAALCLWELLAGRNPLEGVQPFEIMRTVANPSIPSLKSVRPDLPDSLDEALMKGLAVNPDERYASAEEMRGRLTAVMLEIDPDAGPERLAAFMREQFAGEYASERKAIGLLTKLSDQESDACAQPSPEVLKAQAAFKPTEASGSEATAGGLQPAAPRSSQRPGIPASRRSRQTPVPGGRRVLETAGDPLETPAADGRQALDFDDRPTPVNRRRKTDEPGSPSPRETPPASVRERRAGRTGSGLKPALLIGIGISGLVGAAVLGFTTFGPFASSNGPRASTGGPEALTPLSGPLRPPAKPQVPPDPPPSASPAADAPQAVPATLALLRSGRRLSKGELAAVFQDLQSEIAKMKQTHDCSLLGRVCSLSDEMRLQYEKMLPDARKHEQLRSLLAQSAEALEHRRQLLANSDE